jgi:type III pantothenate kinase
VELRIPERAIGRDTAAAIQSGTVLGHVAMVQGLLGKARRELADAADMAPADVHVVLTGGLSRAPFAASIEGVESVDPDLTLKGLAILHAEVAGGTPLELHLT